MRGSIDEHTAASMTCVSACRHAVSMWPFLAREFYLSRHSENTNITLRLCEED